MDENDEIKVISFEILSLLFNIYKSTLKKEFYLIMQEFIFPLIHEEFVPIIIKKLAYKKIQRWISNFDNLVESYAHYDLDYYLSPLIKQMFS